MPLPDATDPNESRLYDLFKGQKIEDFSADSLDKLRDTIFIEPKSEDLMRRIVLLGEVSGQLSLAGPITRTQKNIQATYTSTGDDAIFFQPDSGEVWQIVGGDTLGTGGTGSINWSLVDSAGVFAFIFQTSVNGQEPIFQNTNNNNIATPIYVTRECYLHANITAVATSVRASINFIRVR